MIIKKIGIVVVMSFALMGCDNINDEGSCNLNCGIDGGNIKQICKFFPLLCEGGHGGGKGDHGGGKG